MPFPVPVPQTAIHWVLAASAGAAVMFFAAGLNGYFERPIARPRWVRVVHGVTRWLSVLHAVVVVATPPRSDAWAAAGVACYSVAVALFLSAIEAARRTRLQRAFVDDPLPDRLIREGPFRWVRHPFYVGYVLGAVAGPLAVDSLALVVLAAAMVVLTVYAAVREERVWLASARADEYRRYRRQTGMFLPFVGRG